MKRTIYVPNDAAARALGADRVAKAILDEAKARGYLVEIVRNGSRGMTWLEPLIEVESSGGRVAFGPCQVGDVGGVLAEIFEARGKSPLSLGPTEKIPYLQAQTRFTFRRVGLGDPTSFATYEQNGGLDGLKRALALAPAEIVESIVESGLRGRGGAAFPTGIKWKTVLTAGPAGGGRKHIVCNADEGDSGTFSDRLIMEGDPFLLIEGMVIAGLAVGAEHGWIYLRSEYPHAERILLRALAVAREHNLLGPSILGSGRAFDIKLRRGAGAYICGEETALLESLEGKRGMVRPKPPLPAISGLFGEPTVVNNVITLAAVPTILSEGAKAYAAHGNGRSRGTLPFQLAGNIKRGGLVEVPMGITLRELIYEFGGGTASGRPIRAVQVGGPLGPYLPASKLDTKLDYESMSAAGGMLGHGGVVVFDDTVDMAKMARYAMEFCAIESCGKCTPCRIGATRGVEVIDRIVAGERREQNLELLHDLCDTMVAGSLCAMGGMTPLPVLSALEHFAGDFRKV
jgi:formate dehydrogenase iron-sulfur subunit